MSRSNEVRGKWQSTRLSDNEKKHVDIAAKRLGVSRSDLLRRAIMGYNMPDNFKSRGPAVDVLRKLNADQARLGNLLKLAINRKKTEPVRVSGLLRDIGNTQSLIARAVKDITN